MSIHQRKMRRITLTLGDESPSPPIPETAFEDQIFDCQVINNTEDGEKIYTYGPDGEDREEADPDWALQLEFYSDWRDGGISDYLREHNGEWVDFDLERHPNLEEEHTRESGRCKLRAPTTGGAVRATETQTVTFQIKGEPDYERVESPESPS